LLRSHLQRTLQEIVREIKFCDLTSVIEKAALSSLGIFIQWQTLAMFIKVSEALK
jgi:hypothetical protein